MFIQDFVKIKMEETKMHLFKKRKNIILKKKDNFLINTVTKEKVGRIEGNKIVFIKNLPEGNYVMKNE